MALVYFRELDSYRKFAIWKIEEDQQSLVSKLQLSESELNKLDQLRKGKRTLHWLATRVLLRQMLDTEKFIECPSDEHGKPYLVNFPYALSLTHSYDYAAVMLSSRGECGIDLEIVRDTAWRIRDKFLKKEEQSFVLGHEYSREQLYACWCAKEAVYKLQGKKGVSFLNDMTILPFTYDSQGTLHVVLTLPTGERHIYTVFYEKFNEYMLGYVHEDLK